MSRRLLASALLAALAVALWGGRAMAGEFHVYGCRMPDGQSAPADGWSGAKVGTYAFAEDTCSQPDGALTAALGDQAARLANTDSATWAFAAPEGERIANAVLWRAGDADGGAAVNATYEFWLAGPTKPSVFEECVYALGCTSGLGVPGVPLAPGNRVEVPAANRGSALYAVAACGGVSEYKCKEAQGDANNYAAVVYIYASDITLEQGQGPAASAPAGELATAATVSGTADLTFTATDPGAGVYAAQISVDGQLVQTVPLDENGGRCRDVGQTADGLHAFLYVEPCLRSLSADVGLDTTALTNGAHHLVVTVLDAAGNSAVVLDREIVVANAGSSPGGGGGAGAGAGTAPAPAGPVPVPNGTNASSPAVLRAGWVGARGRRLELPYGRAAEASGQLTTPAGAPIQGASIEVSSTPAAAGSHTVALAPVRTSATGAFALHIPKGAASSALRFAYRSTSTATTPAAIASLTLAVRAGVSLSITPRTVSVGHRIRFSGRLRGGPFPASGKLVVLEARSGQSGWIEFDVVRADRHGHFHASYRFRFPGPLRYGFRAVSQAEGDYPYATGASGSVVVHER
ncbi:MAG TPA: hypothetical protein VHT27_05140 [Solirubrobacteraceae bacterium]|jgi:hypothetical protein|nr:hypothetical protein [Solirubrobacteraceae bacterium]